MLVPVIFDSQQYSRSRPPELGERVRFELFWNDPFARLWAGLRPGWSLTANLTATNADTVVHLGSTPEQNTRLQPATATSGGLRFGYTSTIPVPATLTVSGALRVTAFDTPNRPPGEPLTAWSNTVDEDRVTTGIVQRLQLVSILNDFRTGSHVGWHELERIAGTEWFYNLVNPPESLHVYRPAEEPDDRAPRTGFSVPVRTEILVLDLAVDD
ncbi:hypothetical protein O4160_22360 [Rhodococcus sp. IEGM 1401]|uniref:hypothetical protein n=1 Tax=unclassified Rhodococcus (in: high G+C Gram-positive bacteria) TaxID=192944 RepID=UPI001FB237E4|nr:MULTISPECIES: hypothetical protein [unclassified Rhodococcus (in: high G+C Gram-positive bacteria)]MCZ4563587.1 hypothetical protein [Rhodococcus sp. IEGM 1401]MDI9923720.1 hypothetical protein [Rhodococcus sp. IEGM 1372]MDV8036202.1 hypothetical protein [Rhodococcus sp. IEGM 1414]